MKRKRILYISRFLCLISICMYIFQDIYATYIKNPCTIRAQGKDFVVSPQCLLRGTLPKMSLQTAVDEVWSEVQGFESIYQAGNKKFTYEATQPVYKKKYPSLVPETQAEKESLRKAATQGKFILITKNQLAHYYLNTYSFYVADKDISQLKPCTRKNYEVAFSSLDKQLVPKGELYNLNIHLESLQGYCRGQNNDELMFYGGVCGVSSQLFRVALLHPRITITQRAPHNEWFTVYYGQEVHGDDAAMMQMRKQFEIKNTSDAAVYIRTKKFGETTYIAAISPYKIDDFVAITKTWNSELSVKLTKQIYKKTWKKRRTEIPTPVFPSQDTHIEDGLSYHLLQTISFDSVYMGKNNESR